MSTLHVLSHSPFSDQRLHSCLRLLGDDDAILLSGDAVYALAPGSEPWAALASAGVVVFALAEDAQARALPNNPGVELLDYPAFVELTLAYEKVNSWL
ncbi:sulfurtransferase complex subunit TusB [Pseudomonas baltica]|uniref:Sulfurtransferase complex subunit TusB n=1 Tax=Pseudomonas baltica TaxID=2762576 RepID=A0A7X1KS02_9PSED|nr:sulfurtransferase complex subunit TusB [Pseudomonas baltica]MBC2677191.1 sulfurtransferase complex subunit TusB [Pseudomonas baltica]